MEAKHTPGPWAWTRYGDKFPWFLVAEHSGRLTVMDTARMGTRLAQPRFAIREEFKGGIMYNASKIDLPNHPDARLIAAAPDLLEALQALLRRDERNTCQHEETKRGGIIWTICNQCGAKWADDEGGKPEWKDPPEWDDANAAIAKATSK